jgi:hypothetical protein
MTRTGTRTRLGRGANKGTRRTEGSERVSELMQQGLGPMKAPVSTNVRRSLDPPLRKQVLQAACFHTADLTCRLIFQAPLRPGRKSRATPHKNKIRKKGF